MAESKVQFIVDAELGKAIQQMLKVKDAQDRVVEGFHKIGKSGKHAEGITSELFGEVKSLVTGYLSFEGLKTGAEAWMHALEGAGERLVQTRKDLAGLMVQGNNVFNSGEIREQVLNLAAMNGRSNKEMADSMAMIQSAFGELGEGKGKLALDTTLKLNSALGGSADATALVTKAMQVYGKDLDTVGKASDKLFAFHASLSGVEDSAQFLAAVAPDAARAGASFDQVAASLSLLSQQGGKTKETAAAAKALFKGIGDAMEEGLVPKTENFVGAMERLSKLDPQTLRKLFGDSALGEVTRLFKAMEQLREEIDKLQKMRGGDVEKRIAAGYEDPSMLAATGITLAKSQGENILELQSDELQGAATDYEMAKLGAASRMGPLMRGMGMPTVAAFLGGRGSSDVRMGKQITLINLRKAGKNDLADQLGHKWGMDAQTGDSHLRELQGAVDEAKSKAGTGLVDDTTNRARTEEWMNRRVDLSNYKRQMEIAAEKQLQAAEMYMKNAEGQKRHMLIDNAAHRE